MLARVSTNSERRHALARFVAFTRTLKGDEKSEAQIFLDHFFRALGHGGVQEAGATLEFRIAKKPGSPQLELLTDDAAKAKRGGKKFADLLWPDRVLIEMKSRGVPLEKQYDQIFDYWTHIVPKRPPYVVLCNFDQLWIYDFNVQLFDPVERLAVRDLADNPNALAFLFPHRVAPVFGNNRVDVTRKAADDLAHVFRDLVARGVARDRAQRFILQLLVALVSEDIELLPDLLVTRTLQDCLDGQSSFDLFGGLFRQMNSRQRADGGRFQQVDYFNGGLFETVDPVELRPNELSRLHDAAKRYDWSQVKPEIFGTIFQASMDKEERHAFGAHFTSEFDIQKVVGPTIARPWQERIEACGRDKARLRAALDDLRRFRVLDPACGSGNFLFVAYRVMKRLERDLLARLRRAGAGESITSEVRLSQFYGMDVLPFAAELAKVTLMLAKELEVREAHAFGQSEDFFIEEKALPLENLEGNILCADALFTPWPAADAIIGNPPYLGAKLLKPTHGADYADKVRAAFPAVPGMADFCVYWFRKAHDQLAADGRAGLVGTQNIRNNQSRVGGLDYITQTGGTIVEAVARQVWSGEAAVHVSVVNWIKGDQTGEKVLTLQNGDSVESPWETYTLDMINAALSVGFDVTSAQPLFANTARQRCFTGQMIGHEKFLITSDERDELIKEDPKTVEVTFPYLNGREFLSGGNVTDRYVIDFGQRDRFEAEAHPAALQWVKNQVLPDRQKNAEKGVVDGGKMRSHHKQFLARWWQLAFPRVELMSQVNKRSRFIVCSRVTKRPIFIFVSQTIRPGDALSCFTFEDDYSFGILQSSAHFVWFVAKCSKLKGDFRYSPESVFDTFPWPQGPTRKQIAEVAAAAVALRGLRREVMTARGWSLRELYRTLDTPGDNPLRTAQARLDAAVRAAYAMPPNADPLAFLLALNLALAAQERAGTPVVPPGLPLPEAEHAAFVTEDCVRAPLPSP